jgi:hypothetical protein
MPLENVHNEVVLRSLAFELVGDLLVMCLGSGDPSNRDWEQWAERCRKLEHRGILITTAGGAPNSRQRARIAEVMADVERPPPVALLTDSAVIRHVMTAFSWLLGRKQAIKALPPSATLEAIQWLNVSAPLTRVQEALVRLQSAVANASKRAD